MNIRETILQKHSKAQCTKIVHWVGSSEVRFDKLFNLFINDDNLVVQRAAWPVSYCVDAYPQLISKHWKTLVENLRKPGLHDAVKRNSIRLMQDIDLPEKYHGEIMDLCFKYLESPAEALAVRIFSLSVLGNLATHYPEIKAELKLIIEDQLPHQSAGFKSRAKKVLKQLNKL